MEPKTDDDDQNHYLPDSFGRYKVKQRIGLGGFASVYSALDPELNSIVAVKVLADNHSADGETRRRFLEEARVARQIASDRLVNVYDVGQTADNRPYVVMQFADRGTLGSRLGEVIEPTTRDIRLLVTELATCLMAIHERNIVHRDIKPSNLLLHSLKGKPEDTSGALIRTDERVVLADFGLARDISSGVSGMTIAGGTAGYMAPEQLKPDGQPDHRADLYAASSIIAAIACGVHPERLNLPESHLPLRLKNILTEHLSVDPNRRPESAKAWRDQLLGALNHNEAQDTAEVKPSDLHESHTQPWQPPPQPQPPTPPQSPYANNTPQTPSGGSNQFASHPTPTPAPQDAYQPQPFGGYSNQTPRPVSYQGPGQPPLVGFAPAHKPRKSVAHGMARGAISLVVSFILLYIFAAIIHAIEGSAGTATGLAVALAVFGPLVLFFVGYKYLPWPRPK